MKRRDGPNVSGMPVKHGDGPNVSLLYMVSEHGICNTVVKLFYP
jgi:hypothetical protein